MKDVIEAPAIEPQLSAARMPEMPTPQRIRVRLRRVWLLGLVVFGYGPAFTYGALTWLLNDNQWGWTYLMYFTLVPVVGGVCVGVLPELQYRPVHRVLMAWINGQGVTQAQLRLVYERTLRLPWQVAAGAFAAATIGYLGGTAIVHWQSNQPWIEIAKTMPAIPLVGGMMGAFCYFGTVRALHPVMAWCSRQLPTLPDVPQVSMGVKFLTTTCVLALAVLCLLLPAAYTLGQTVTEEHLQERVLERLQVMVQRVTPFERIEDRVPVLQEAVLGKGGYVFATDLEGRIVTPHPYGYTTVNQEQFYRLEQHMRGEIGVWVDRVGHHRVVAFVRRLDPRVIFFSVAFPTDFSFPLRHFLQLSMLVVVEIFVVVLVFGRYYTKGITTPLAELMSAAEQIAQRGDLNQRVPITTNDEISDLARSFNRMVEELRASKTDLESYTKQLERSTQELSALNQEMEDLLHVVSHDLRAPLINVQGFSKRLEPLMQETVAALDQIAAQSGEGGLRAQVQALKSQVQSRFAESLRFISKGVEKMDTLLSLLLAISRVGRKADPLQPNHLDDILDDVLATFDHQLQERAIRIIRHPLPTQVPCRRNEMNQVFSNLLSNAIHYMGPSGDRFIEIGAEPQDDDIECYVRDTGIGIAAADHERVFQMFTRLQAIDVPGEGVGLAYVRKILRSHGGRIRVVSAKGQGSTFFFTLPMTRETATRGVGR